MRSAYARRMPTDDAEDEYANIEIKFCLKCEVAGDCIQSEGANDAKTLKPCPFSIAKFGNPKTWDDFHNEIPTGYESTASLSKRLGIDIGAIRSWAMRGRVEHLVRSFGKGRKIIFIKLGAELDGEVERIRNNKRHPRTIKATDAVPLLQEDSY